VLAKAYEKRARRVGRERAFVRRIGEDWYKE
jgi:hypothetical protein